MNADFHGTNYTKKVQKIKAKYNFTDEIKAKKIVSPESRFKLLARG